jgi:penicillin-binding protein 1A
LINPSENKKRQEIILGEMLEQNLITQKEYDSAIAYKLVFNTSVNSAKTK